MIDNKRDFLISRTARGDNECLKPILQISSLYIMYEEECSSGCGFMYVARTFHRNIIRV